MKPFRFRLERLMRLAESQRRVTAIELAQQQRVLDQQERKVADAVRRRDRVGSSYRDLAARSATAAQWQGARLALTMAGEEIARRQEEARRVALDVETARRKLIERSREVETFERLRRRKREEYAVAERREDLKINDALALERFARTGKD